MDIVRAELPLDSYGSSEILSFSGIAGEATKEHFAVVFQGSAGHTEPPLVRVHSECVTGDVLGSLRCDCGKQLHEALARLSSEGGVLIYLRQEGRGIGLHEKIKAYRLQAEGVDTFEANERLGHREDSRSYVAAARILDALGMRSIRLLTRNPEKARQLGAAGIDVVEQVPTALHVNTHNARYIDSKESRWRE